MKAFLAHSLNSRILGLVTLLVPVLLSTGCAHIDRFNDKSWVVNEFIIDGLFQIEFDLPLRKPETGGLKDQFILTQEGKAHPLFVANYDRGYGKVRDLHYTRMLGSIVPFSESDVFDGDISPEEIMTTFFLREEGDEDEFIFDGENVFAEFNWLKVRRKFDFSTGISFAAPVYGRYVLILTMDAFNQEFEESELFRLREQTLVQVVKSVRVITLK